MIVSKVHAPKAAKGRAAHIRDLTAYIMAPHLDDPAEKVCYSGNRGMLSRSLAGHQAEMIALSMEAPRVRYPVAHWIISWREGEHPTPANVEELVDEFLNAMDMVSHQAVYAVHHNTHNRHLHIALGRISPLTLQPVFPNGGFDHEVAHQVIARIEHRQGWADRKSVV